jgi:hypothetical protein
VWRNYLLRRMILRMIEVLGYGERGGGAIVMGDRLGKRGV